MRVPKPFDVGFADQVREPRAPPVAVPAASPANAEIVGDARGSGLERGVRHVPALARHELI